MGLKGALGFEQYDTIYDRNNSQITILPLPPLFPFNLSFILCLPLLQTGAVHL